MWVGVLGPLEVRDGDRLIPIRGTIRTSLLAALVCRAPQVVLARQLIEDLWGPNPPRSAEKTLQSHLVRLRRELGSEGSCILTSGSGYRIDAERTGIDAHQFADAVESVRGQLAQGQLAQGQPATGNRPAGSVGPGRADVAGTIELLDEALHWWRGDPYADLADAPFLVAERIRLQELRLCAQEWRTDAAMALGESSSLVEQLERWVAVHPFRERLWEQLILALYRSGRQVDALAAYRRVHRLLNDELGIEPGPGLQDLQQKVLGHDRSVLRPPVAARTARECPYRGLEGYHAADAAVFFGREHLVSTVVGRLAEPGVVVVTGASGSGKSSLLRAGVAASLRVGALPGSGGWRIAVRTPGRAGGMDSPDLLILDQCEELLTDLTETAAAAVVEQIKKLVDRGGRVVIAVRGDYFARLVEHPYLARWAERGPVLVGALRERDLQRVVVEPAALAGVTVTAETVDAVLEEASGQPQPLPLLSVALVRAWEHRTGDEIDLTAYRHGGGIGGAIEAAAERCYAGMTEAEQAAARRLLVRLAQQNGTTWAGRTRPLPIDPPTRRVVDALATSRLVTASERTVAPAHDALLQHWPRLRDWLDEHAAAAEMLRHLAVATDDWRSAGSPAADLYRGARLQAVLDWRKDHPDDLTVDEAAFVDASERAADAELVQATTRADRERRGRRRLRRVAWALVAALVATIVATTVATRARSSADGAAAAARQEALVADARRLAAQSLAAPDTASAAQLAVAGYRLQDSDDTRGALLAAVLRSPSAAFRVLLDERPISMVASPAGDRLYVYEINHSIQVIDPRTRSVVGSYPARFEHLVGVVDGGRELIVNGSVDPKDPAQDARVSVLNSQTGAVERTLSTSAMFVPDQPALSPDGRWLVTVNSTDLGQTPTNQIVVRDTQNSNDPPRTSYLPAPVREVAAGPTTVAVESISGGLYLIDPVTLRVTASVQRTDLPDDTTVAAASGYGPLLTIDPTGRNMAYASPTGTVNLLALATPGGVARTIPVPNRVVQTLAFSADGSQLAIGFADGGVMIARTSGESAAENLTGHTGAVRAAAWVSGHLLTAAGDSTVIGWQTATTSPMLTADGSTVVDVSTIGRFGDMVIGTLGGTTTPYMLYSLDLRNGQQKTWSDSQGDDAWLSLPTATTDGRTLLVSVLKGDDSVFRYDVWDVESETKVASVPANDNGLALILPDGHALLTATNDGIYRIVSLPSGRVERTFRADFAGPGGEHLDIRYFQPIAVTPDGDVLVEGVAPDPVPPTAPGQPSSAGGGAASPTRIQLGLIDPRSGRMVAQSPLAAIAESSLGWSRDRSTLAIGTVDGTVETLDAHTLAVRHSPVVVASNVVQSVDFSADGEMLVVGGADSTLSLWSADTLTRLGPPLTIPVNPYTSWWAWFNPDGDITGLMPTSTGAVGGDQPYDGLHFTFPGRPEEWIAPACRLAGGPMSAAAWTSEIPDQPYRQLC